MTDHELPKATRDALQRSPSRRDWDGAAAVIAAFVGLLALCVSGYTAWLQRQQVRAQVWPYIETSVSGSKYKIMLANKGVGPAMIRSVRMYVDGKPQHNWHDTLTALGLKFDHSVPYSTISGIVLSAGDHVDQLVLRDADEFNAFAKVANRATMEICYCSTMNECWIRDDRQSGPDTAVRETPMCPARDGTEFRDNENAEPAIPAEENK
ncbi:MAG TPA: hypothetical protein VHW73_04950 [Rudaea sp.]|nr:hypothetical protein [Rudaea sp.]